MAQFILANGLMIQEMVMEHKSGLMEANTRASGGMTKLTVKVNCCMQTETCTKESGKMIKLTAEANILMPMAPLMMGSG